MLIINEKNIADSVSPEELISAVEKAYLIQNNKETYIPDRPHLDYNGNTLLLMPGFTGDVFGTKLVTLFPENSSLGKPVLSGIMVLNDIKTGFPKAILNAGKLTAMRTGAVGATAVKHLAPENSVTLGIIGAGVQAYHQIMLSYQQRNFQKILISDANNEFAINLMQSLSNVLKGVEIETVKDANKLVKSADVIITASSSEKPVFDTDLSKFTQKCFIGIGSYKPNMHEFPTSSFEFFNNVFVDTLFAKEESGDIKIPLEEGILSETDICPFRKILTKDINVNLNEINFFKSVGMSLFDLTTAELIYNKTIEKGLGTRLEL